MLKNQPQTIGKTYTPEGRGNGLPKNPPLSPYKPFGMVFCIISPVIFTVI